MIFVDTNVFVHAVGGPHPLREPARGFFREALGEGIALCTWAEVLQELLHLYLGVERLDTLDAALELARRSPGPWRPRMCSWPARWWSVTRGCRRGTWSTSPAARAGRCRG